MQVTKLGTTKYLGNIAIAGEAISNPTNVAAVTMIDFGVIPSTGTSINLLASVTLPAGANITNMYIATSGTGTIWAATPSWKVSVTTNGTQPATGNLINGLSSTISAFGQAQDLLKSSWVTMASALNVLHGSVVYLYTSSPFTTPITANAYFYVEYYITA